jgi:hypothetical protein
MSQFSTYWPCILEFMSSYWSWVLISVYHNFGFVQISGPQLWRRSFILHIWSARPRVPVQFVKTHEQKKRIREKLSVANNTYFGNRFLILIVVVCLTWNIVTITVFLQTKGLKMCDSAVSMFLNERQGCKQLHNSIQFKSIIYLFPCLINSQRAIKELYNLPSLSNISLMLQTTNM